MKKEETRINCNLSVLSNKCNCPFFMVKIFTLGIFPDSWALSDLKLTNLLNYWTIFDAGSSILYVSYYRNLNLINQFKERQCH